MIKIKYPKFLILFTIIVAAYFIFSGWDLHLLRNLISLNIYLSAFITGLFFTYSFTTPPAAAIFIIIGNILQSENLILLACLGGLGALMGDIIIFSIIRYSFKDEIAKLSKEKLIKKINSHIPHFIKTYILILLAASIIASPFPDELGVTLFAATRIKASWFALFSFLANTIGILIMLKIGGSI